MKVALGSDGKGPLIDALLEELKARAIDVRVFGPPAALPAEPGQVEPGQAEPAQDVDWPLTSAHVARAVAAGDATWGIVCCWTGTGASIAANKVRGVRAALCGDAETAKGARLWNDANVLALSLRATTPAVGKEILAAWLETQPARDEWNTRQLERVAALESAFGTGPTG